MTDPFIQVQDLTHVFPDGRTGINKVTFSVQKREFILLAGRNGCGKTTLLRHLNGLLRPTSGRVTLYNTPILSNLAETRKKIGMVFQDADTQIVGETVFDDVAFGPENLRLPRARINEKVDETLELTGLSPLRDRSPATLSGGEKKRLAIAGVLVMDPEVILFDEPFANLDFPGTAALLSAMASLHDAGITLMVASHDIEKTASMATRIIIMDQGEIKADGRMETLVRTVENYGIREPCSSRFGMGIRGFVT